MRSGRKGGGRSTQDPGLKGFIVHFKESALYLKYSKGKDRECGVEMEY